MDTHQRRAKWWQHFIHGGSETPYTTGMASEPATLQPVPASDVDVESMKALMLPELQAFMGCPEEKETVDLEPVGQYLYEPLIH